MESKLRRNKKMRREPAIEQSVAAKGCSKRKVAGNTKAPSPSRTSMIKFARVTQQQKFFYKPNRIPKEMPMDKGNTSGLSIEANKHENTLTSTASTSFFKNSLQKLGKKG